MAALVGLASIALAGSACGGKPAPKVAKLEAGSMPEGGEWTGVYYSPLFGYLHLIAEGNQANGKWERPVKDRWGEIHGTIQGDLLRFSWTEYTRGTVGPGSKETGKGYFRYKRPEGENVDDQLVGERGADQDELGEPWEAIKQRNMQVDLQSIGGSGAEDLGGGEWDKGNTEGGQPEEPAPPPP